MRSFIIISFFILSITACAQSTDTLKREGKSKYLPTGIRLATDVLSLARSEYSKSFDGWEVNADVDFDRYYFVVDYGKWSREYQPKEGPYKNDGTYWRTGIDVNFLAKDPDRNMFFIGGRYGKSNFSERFEVTLHDVKWGDFNTIYTNTDVNAHWFELTTGLRIKVWEFLWMGYTARFKFGLKMDETQEMIPHDVPGYGRTDKDTYWGFNYQIFFRIPFRKTPTP